MKSTMNDNRLNKSLEYIAETNSVLLHLHSRNEFCIITFTSVQIPHVTGIPMSSFA